ncbi:(Fe-S)-binding protein [Streptomyces sp. BRA346]
MIVRPLPVDGNLRVTPHRTPLPLTTVLPFHADDGDFAKATRRCVGVGKCRTAAPGSGVMCPSYRVTRDEKGSTRGRARLLHEMTRGEVITDGWRSREVRDALDLCLSCKGCSSDCPVGVDMATYKSGFLHRHYKRRVRPASHYTMGWLPLLSRPAARTPRLVNALTSSRLAPLVERLGASPLYGRYRASRTRPSCPGPATAHRKATGTGARWCCGSTRSTTTSPPMCSERGWRCWRSPDSGSGFRREPSAAG